MIRMGNYIVKNSNKGEHDESVKNVKGAFKFLVFDFIKQSI